MIVKKSGSFSIIALDACALSFCSKKLILTLNQRLELSLSEGKGEEREGLSFQGKRERRGRLEMLALDCALDLSQIQGSTKEGAFARKGQIWTLGSKPDPRDHMHRRLLKGADLGLWIKSRS